MQHANANDLQLVANLAVAAQAALPEIYCSKLTLIPDGMQLVNLEPHQHNRNRLRGKFATNQLAAFIAHAIAQHASYTDADPDTVYAVPVFIQPENMRAQAIYNLGTLGIPGHCDHTASLTLQPTPALKALQQLTSTKWSQQDLAEWIEDWAALITDIDDTAGNPMDHSQLLANIRSMTIESATKAQHEVGNFSASSSKMDQIEAKGKGATPAGMLLRLQPYPDLDEIEVTVRLSVLTGGDKPAIRCRWVGQQQQEEAMANDLRAKITAALGDTATIYLGSYSA